MTNTIDNMSIDTPKSIEASLLNKAIKELVEANNQGLEQGLAKQREIQDKLIASETIPLDVKQTVLERLINEGIVDPIGNEVVKILCSETPGSQLTH